MGLLTLGTPMSWEDAKKKSDYIHEHGIQQFLNVWDKVSKTKRDSEGLLWGDEIEYSVVNMDKYNKVARLSLNAADTLKSLQEDELLNQNYQASWKPEYAKYMIEGTPGLPYGSKFEDLLKVEKNMNLRRQLIREKLGTNDMVVSITAFPMLGAPDFLYPNNYHPNPDPKLISLSPELFKNIDDIKFNDENSKPSFSQSLYIPDQAVTDHARFPTLTANIRERRGSKVAINLPIYKDHLTPMPFREPVPESIEFFVDNYANNDKTKDNNSTLNDMTLYSSTCSSSSSTASEVSDSESIYCHSLNESINDILKIEQQHKIQYTLPDVIQPAKEDHVYLDCMCFGMGCSCLQVTFQATDVQEARYIYDTLAPVTPLLLALTAGAPAYKGYLVDTDCRWNVISGSVDDRNPIERGLREAEPGETKENGKPFLRINKSRYDSIDSYLSTGPDYTSTSSSSKSESSSCQSHDYYKDKYNDIDLVYDKEIFNHLMQHGIDELLAKHIAHLFIRDPLVIYKELLHQNDDMNSTDNFENIQSTNWQTLRFKLPPPNTDIGWRIEFRSMEVQLTDFANAAFSIFILLLTRTIKNLNLNFYIPISKIDENMKMAQVRDAARTKKFWFRRHVLPTKEGKTENEINNNDDDDSYELMTIDQIMNGFTDEKGTFPGILSLICKYLSQSKIEKDILHQLNRYLTFISKRASGELVTDAVWIRDFITHHKDYQHDSKIHPTIIYDLMNILEGVNQHCPKSLIKIMDTVGVDGVFTKEEKENYINEIKMKLEQTQKIEKEISIPYSHPLKVKRIFKSLNNCYQQKEISSEEEKENTEEISSTSSSPEVQMSEIKYFR